MKPEIHPAYTAIKVTTPIIERKNMGDEGARKIERLYQLITQKSRRAGTSANRRDP